MYNRTFWQDHVTTNENKYRKTENSDGTITLTPDEGEVIQRGTPQSAKYFNKIEAGIFNVTEFATEIFRTVLNLIRRIDDRDEEIDKINAKVKENMIKIEVDLSNSLDYPFNNSKTTVSFEKQRANTIYEVDTYSDSKNIGKIIVSDKQKNGFKLEYTGGAKNAKIRCYIRGVEDVN